MAIFVGVVLLNTWQELDNPKKIVLATCEDKNLQLMENHLVSLRLAEDENLHKHFRVIAVRNWANCTEFIQQVGVDNYWPSSKNYLDAYLRCVNTCPIMNNRTSLTISRNI